MEIPLHRPATTTASIPGWGSNSLSLIPGAGEKPYDDRVDEAIRQGKYFTFVIKPKDNKKISFTEIPEHKLRRSKDGPKRFRWQYKVGDGEFIDLLDKGASASSVGTLILTIKLSNYSDLQNITSEVTFRIIPYNASRSGGVGNIFNCVLQVKGNIN